MEIPKGLKLLTRILREWNSLTPSSSLIHPMSILYISDKIRKSGSEIHYSYKNPWWSLGSMNEDKQRALYLLKVESFC
jgi:hypothetical protein